MSRILKSIHKQNTCELRSSQVGTTEADLSHGIDHETGQRNDMVFLEIRDNDVDPIILLGESNDNSSVRFDLRIEEAEALVALLLSDPEVQALHEKRRLILLGYGKALSKTDLGGE